MHQTPDVAQAAAALDDLLKRVEERCGQTAKVGADLLALKAARGALVAGGWAVRRADPAHDGDEAARLLVPASRVRKALDTQSSFGLRATPGSWSWKHWRCWGVILQAVASFDGAPHLPAPEPAPEPKRRGKAQGKAVAQRRRNPSAWNGRH